MALKDVVKRQLAICELANQLVDAKIAESVVGRKSIKISVLIQQGEKQHVHLVSVDVYNEGKYARVLQRESAAWNAQKPNDKLASMANLVPEVVRRSLSAELERKGFTPRAPGGFLPRSDA